MARVHKRKARADIYSKGLRTKSDQNKSGWSIDRSKPADEKDTVLILKGQEYYTWTMFHGTPQISLTYPTRQQTTGSAFLCSTYDLEDRVTALSDYVDIDDLESERDNIVSEIHDLASEQEEKKFNMPDHLQEAPTGELLQNRYDSLEEWASNLENVDISWNEPDKEEDEDGESFEARKDRELAERIDEIVSELQNYIYEGE